MPKKKQVFVVMRTSGNWRHVAAVFSTRKRAAKFCAENNLTFDIETANLDDIRKEKN